MISALKPEIPNIDGFLSHCRRHPAKSTIIYAGDDSDALYFIIEGSVSVLIENDEDREMIVAYLNKGDFFGEMGVFDSEETRSAWVKTKTECEVAEISYSKFQELREQYPKYFLHWERKWRYACAISPVKLAI
ncbi:MAG: CRP/FNR family cyclic AMP-dependent transcriptional regulator [Bermanella sp.]|jgi:CRP/FNR family cyclic AMP-dependent transcriptional regulator